MRKMIPQMYFPVFARVPIETPHVFAQKLIPQEIFPACIGFVPGDSGQKTTGSGQATLRDSLQHMKSATG